MKASTQVTAFQSRRYLLDDLLTGVRLPVLDDGVCVSETEECPQVNQTTTTPPKQVRLDSWGTSSDAWGLSPSAAAIINWCSCPSSRVTPADSLGPPGELT